MPDTLPHPNQASWQRPEGASLEDWMNTRIARFATRRYDWDALKFQEQVGHQDSNRK